MPPDQFNEAVRLLQSATAADARGKKGDAAAKLEAAVIYTEVLPLLVTLSQREFAPHSCALRVRGEVEGFAEPAAVVQSGA